MTFETKRNDPKEISHINNESIRTLTDYQKRTSHTSRIVVHQRVGGVATKQARQNRKVSQPKMGCHRCRIQRSSKQCSERHKAPEIALKSRTENFHLSMELRVEDLRVLRSLMGLYNGSVGERGAASNRNNKSNDIIQRQRLERLR